MRHLTLAMAAGLTAALALLAAPALADKGNKIVCPPGLSKTDPLCLIFTQGKKGGKVHKDEGKDEGDHEDEDEGDDDHHARTPRSVTMLNPADYPDWCDSQVVRAGDRLYRIDAGSGRILDLIGPVSDWTWKWDQTDFAHCPPGLAKKNPPCIPPGQAKKHGIEPYHLGQRVPADHIVVIDPKDCTPADRAPVVRQGDAFFRQLSGDDKAILALSLMAAMMK